MQYPLFMRFPLFTRFQVFSGPAVHAALRLTRHRTARSTTADT
jgi:hypothetical protein